MTGKERVALAVQHKEADRVPIDLGSIRSSGIAAQAYNNLLKTLHVEEQTKMFDFQQQLAYPSEIIRKRLHVDAVNAGQGFLKSRSEWRDWKLNDGSFCRIPNYLNLEQDSKGNTWLKNSSNLSLGYKATDSLYTNQIYWPYGDLPSIPEHIHLEDLQNQMWMIPCSPFHLDINNNEQLRQFTKGIKEFSQRSTEAVVLSLGGSFFETGTFLRKIDNFLVDLYIDRKGTERLLDFLLDQYLERLELILRCLNGYVDILTFGDDLGTQDGLWMSPEIIEELFIPRYKKIWDIVHSKSDCKVFLHSCGSIYSIIGKLIEAGLDILNPIQTSAKNMQPHLLKNEFGKHITFWGGGCDTRDILPFGSPEEVKNHVKRRIELFAKDGGFIFNQIHNILADIPPENVIAMYDAAYEFGQY
jgi:uroporphyrinogen decarboxylase